MIKTIVYFYSANERKQRGDQEDEKEAPQEEVKAEAPTPIIYHEEDEAEAEANISFAENPNSLIQNFQNLIIELGRGDFDEPIDLPPPERKYCSIYIEGRGWVYLFSFIYVYLIYIYNRCLSTREKPLTRFLLYQRMEIQLPFHFVRRVMFKLNAYVNCLSIKWMSLNSFSLRSGWIFSPVLLMTFKLL